MAAGSFTVNNTGSGSEAINSVTVSFSDPGLFSNASLAAAGEESAPAAPGATTTFTFAPALQIPSGGSLSFSLSATAASKLAAGERGPTIVYAGMTGGVPGSKDGQRDLIALCLMGLGLCVYDRRRWLRRTAMVALIVIAMGTAMSACGSSNGGGGASPASSQAVTQIAGPSGAIPYQGLPASLGAVTVQ